MLMKMIHILYNAILKTTADSNKINHGQMLNILTQTHSPSMRTNRNIKFCSHQEYTKYFIYTPYPTTSNLSNIHSTALKKLLKHDPVLAMFSCSHFDRRYSFCNSAMTYDIIGASRFFNPPRIKTGQFRHIFNGFIYLPFLIC